MNIFNQVSTPSSDSVFIEADNSLKIKTMRELLSKGSGMEIQKHFFAGSDGRDLDLSKLVSSQINRHQQVLTYRNKNLLKNVLRSTRDGEAYPSDLKMLNESGTCSPASHENVHQYLTFNDEIDFDEYLQRK